MPFFPFLSQEQCVRQRSMSVIPAPVSTMVPAMTWLETMSASALQVNTAAKIEAQKIQVMLQASLVNLLCIFLLLFNSSFIIFVIFFTVLKIFGIILSFLAFAEIILSCIGFSTMSHIRFFFFLLYQYDFTYKTLLNLKNYRKAIRFHHYKSISY